MENNADRYLININYRDNENFFAFWGGFIILIAPDAWNTADFSI